MLFFKDFNAQRGRQHYRVRISFARTVAIVAALKSVHYRYPRRCSLDRIRSDKRVAKNHFKSTFIDPPLASRRTYDEDDSKGYLIRRSTRTSSSPSGYKINQQNISAIVPLLLVVILVPIFTTITQKPFQKPLSE